MKAETSAVAPFLFHWLHKTGNMEYSEKLKDPRWQKKRLEVFNRDDFQCQKCFDRDSTLVVHHKWYNAGIEPWDYPNNCYITFCEDCHNVFHNVYDIRDIKPQHIPFLSEGINLTDIYLYEYFLQIGLKENGKYFIKNITEYLKSLTIKKDEI